VVSEQQKCFLLIHGCVTKASEHNSVPELLRHFGVGSQCSISEIIKDTGTEPQIENQAFRIRILLSTRAGGKKVVNFSLNEDEIRLKC